MFDLSSGMKMILGAAVVILALLGGVYMYGNSGETGTTQVRGIGGAGN